MLPKELMDATLGNTLTYVYSALEGRLKSSWDRNGRAWDFHQGAPILEALDANRYGVWLKFDGITFDEANAPFRADFIQSTWTATLIYPDVGVDESGFDQYAVLSYVGDIISVFRTTFNDVSLDQSVDWASPPRIINQPGVAATGKRFGLVSFTIRANHSLEPCRVE